MIKKTNALLFLGLVAFLTVQANGGLLKDVRLGMGELGFQQQFTRDIFQDGWDYTFSRAFNDKKYDFGNIELTLNTPAGAPLQGTVSIGHRGIPEVELKLNPTAIDYTFVAFDGVNKLHVDNGVFTIINTDIKVNAFGGYDIQLHVSNRGTLVSDDPNVADVPLDFDLGPINVHGDLLIDLINLTLGKQLGFVIPGGAADQVVGIFNQAVDQQMAQAKAAYEGELKAPAAMSLSTVPEPATVFLLMVGVAGMARRRR